MAKLISNLQLDLAYRLGENVIPNSSTGLWTTIPTDNVLDTTDNLTKTGVIYFATGNQFSGSGIVNGIAGSWMRCRIVTKGSTSPTLTRIQYRTQLGIWLTSINEKYTTQFTIQDELGNPLEDVTVTLTDILGTVTTFTTDVNGQTTATNLTVNVTKFDKKESENNYNYVTVTKNPFAIYVKKAGYETYGEIVTITSKLDKTITLKKGIPNMIDTDGNLYPKLNIANDGAFRDVIIDGEVIV